jgi:hypothetical protein
MKIALILAGFFLLLFLLEALFPLRYRTWYKLKVWAIFYVSFVLM